jgi:hypothetical protein
MNRRRAWLKNGNRVGDLRKARRCRGVIHGYNFPVNNRFIRQPVQRGRDSGETSVKALLLRENNVRRLLCFTAKVR